ncbi:UDP-glucuronic acid decarboxylase family protein [Halostella pelagica]|uniref:UDP-glucuronic acid decarboxylase family protein n=1 Tax=Halostella pelagica TaxID=2583824 RepID=UPI0010800FB5|nr:UDP-glucuronic acid decarboxylase family protein [Halostella pelagica]
MSGRDHAVVTGGAGFVGSHLVDDLVADDYRVTAVDSFASGTPENVSHHADDDRFSLLQRDVRDPLPDFDSVDVIYHFASRASPTHFDSHPIEIAMTNSLGTRHVLEAAVEHDARVVVASTSEVYGDPEVHPQPESYRGNVSPRGPRAPYDESKRFAEALSMAYVRKHDVDARTVRIFNTYGPRMQLDDGRVIPNFLSQALAGDDLTVYGDGEQTRSFCYVTDLVDGIRRLADRPGLQGAVMNVGNTNEITIRELATVVRDVVDTPSEVTYEPRPTDDPDLRCPDVSTARERLDWKPKVPLRAGLAQTADHFRTRRHEIVGSTPED